ncbi:FecR family protein [Confluentibacter lentus]|uniref:FecR family protein n=1 Tax=Confluentibacter lentus TaxID=1699412 RepID=UPI000C28A103|nr:FecR domain-containing protein [Confluentibacter lentus]
MRKHTNNHHFFKTYMYNLYDKFLSDSLTPEEEEDLQFFLKDKKNKKAFEAYLRDLRDTYAALQEPSSIQAYHKIKTVLGRPENQPAKSFNINWFKLVAIVLISLSISYGGYYIATKQSETPVINTDHLITLELEDGSIKTLNEINSETITNSKGKKVGAQKQNLLLYSNEGHHEEEKLVYNKLTIPYGKKFQIVLSDGTHVFLNAGSSLRYPVKFLDKFNRDVYLDGEAFFEVKKDAAHPFTVITEKMNTRVLGTKFNVSSYKNEDNTSSVLVSGAIDVYNASENYNPNKTIRIKPGQRAHFQENNINVEQVNILKYTAWTEGKLFFVEDRFDLILKKLERHFNVSINNTYTALNKEFLTGTFETESLSQILKTFQTYMPFNYTIKGTTITITK